MIFQKENFEQLQRLIDSPGVRIYRARRNALRTRIVDLPDVMA
jgi:hypothetical protein